MRRSGSSSCILLPKEESEGEALSVTICHTEQLPKYSSERFYVLSELEVNGHSTVFLDEEEECNDTQETEESSTSEDRGIAGRSSTSDGYPPYIILYLLWPPEVNARNFVEGTILMSIKTLEGLTTVVPSISEERLSSSLSRNSSRVSLLRTHDSGANSTGEDVTDTHGRIPSRPKEEDKHQALNSSADSSKPIAESSLSKSQSTSSLRSISRGSKVYLVVERVCPGKSDTSEISKDHSDAEQRRYEVQVDIAERLARMVASHSYLRTVFEGITVGVANHYRAAPALEGCLDSILVGSQDRRKYFSKSSGDELTTNTKSLIGMVTSSSSDLLGYQEQEADAVQGVLQCRICAEWSGRGTLQTFARRAHKVWRNQAGLPAEEARQYPFFNSSGLRRRRGAYGDPTDSLELGPSDLFSALLTMCFWVAVGAYIWENWRELLQTILIVDEDAPLLKDPSSDVFPD